MASNCVVVAAFIWSHRTCRSLRSTLTGTFWVRQRIGIESIHYRRRDNPQFNLVVVAYGVPKLAVT